MTHNTILIVDDEPAIVQVICERLEREGFAAVSAAGGEAALQAVESHLPDLIILDLMLPGIDGFEVLRRLRHGGHDLPVIVLTARDDDVDVIVGLELGADDYVVKPFNPRELAARVRAVLRRRAEVIALAERVADLEDQLSDREAAGEGPEPVPDGLHFDVAARRVWYNGELLDLRPREYDLLLFLNRHRGQVLTRATILDHVWGTADYIDERTIDVHIHRLRRKLSAIDAEVEPFEAERGVGYRLQV